MTLKNPTSLRYTVQKFAAISSEFSPSSEFSRDFIFAVFFSASLESCLLPLTTSVSLKLLYNGRMMRTTLYCIL